MSFASVNPATEETIEEFDELTESEREEKIRRSAETFRTWRTVPIEHRAECMHRAARQLRGNVDTFARAMTLEMGKTITQARAEVEKCAWVCEYYANSAPNILRSEVQPSDASESYVRFDPLGPVLAVMPWNFPFWQVFRFAAPALMAGNTALLKHASNVPRCALLIEGVFRAAEFPEGCFQTLLIPSSAVAAVIDHPAVAAATLTGSEHAGSQVAARAGQRLKKTVLELGGSDPFIVLEDADVHAAAATGATARMINTGQSCIAAKRFILHEAVADRFLDRFLDALRAMNIGDPLEEDTDVGPMAREDLLLELDAQIRRSVEMGAELLLGGRRLDRPGVYYPPTVVDHVRPGMPMYDEETFGPAAAIIRVPDEEEALRIANDTSFGLGASLWTADLARAKRMAERIEAGSVFINGLVKSDPRLPFGGIKRSGFGRELSHYGIKEFVNIKTVWTA
ncbi:MAG: NAD-dependent succinate-semialdehyde dehydrogenase [Bacteroidetes bacterium]|nr:NAD-dependent succinate-semialdehyde dehydrogenase [Bacteroidota bacterium]